MGVRGRCLPAGWYPGTARGVREAVAGNARPTPPRRDAVAGVAPHAGWQFSGALASAVFASLSGDLDTIVIIGGHLAPSDGILCAFEEEYETPLGNAPADLELAARLKERVVVAEDRWADNTVEVQLPFARYFFPAARLLGMRAPRRRRPASSAGPSPKRRLNAGSGSPSWVRRTSRTTARTTGSILPGRGRRRCSGSPA